jgi:hypothetical protein
MRLRLLLLLCILPTAGAAQSGTGGGQPRCSRAEYRQFDFWVGEWGVTTPNGQVAGTNRIRQIDGGCALREEWQGARGGTGTSLNIFDGKYTRKG